MNKTVAIFGSRFCAWSLQSFCFGVGECSSHWLEAGPPTGTCRGEQQTSKSWSHSRDVLLRLPVRVIGTIMEEHLFETMTLDKYKDPKHMTGQKAMQSLWALSSTSS